MNAEYPRNTPDFSLLKEQEPAQKGAWLGGMFEIAGTVTITRATTKRVTKNGIKEHTYVYPYIRYGDDDAERIQTLQKIFGGSAHLLKGSNTWVWISQKNQAFPLGELMFPFAPSRREILQGFQNLLETESLEEKIQIYDELRLAKDVEVPKVIYKSLVKNPSFVAGIIDARGTFFPPEKYDKDTYISYIYPNFAVNAHNSTLLKTLQEEYGGSFITITPEGTTVMIRGKPSPVKHGQFRWSMEIEDSRNLLSKIAPYMLFRIEQVSEILQLNQNPI